jgi:hypothetical protein
MSPMSRFLWDLADVLVYPVVIGGVMWILWKIRWSKM